ncbi:MAG: LysR family transcriptional regulator [Paracoccus sp. (in: a-proteobacteria)]|uniref:LysR family transcriptional regulator n=1 Tax=Paracoccus sp. TaxID=267 RepID=UPI0026DF8B26|nr:LysR family transcriptional regulator [Paracoccus sp. (in: a-proteobacteria)]MDO5632389.1 LysR family transcriptional regulator [Paracoccus sp. (in: a-proteobacteria)]
MQRKDITDLIAFLEVAREQSFTKAAARLGVSQSALSHTVRGLEERLDIRLLTRTTRSVSPTEAGERLLARIGPHFEGIASELDGLGALRGDIAGTIRITAGDYQIRHYLWPKLRGFMREFPNVNVEISVEYGLQDIVADRFDAGVRFGSQVARDMIATRISPDIRFVIIGAPSYFDTHPVPTTPTDLTTHDCVNLRLSTHGGLYAWELDDNGRELSVRVEGRLVFNNIYDVIDAARDGFGLAFVPDDLVRADIAAGTLRIVMEDYAPVWEGFHLYYPSRRQHAPAFAALVKALRHRD